jgi:hypothetical protein
MDTSHVVVVPGSGTMLSTIGTPGETVAGALTVKFGGFWHGWPVATPATRAATNVHIPATTREIFIGDSFLTQYSVRKEAATSIARFRV